MDYSPLLGYCQEEERGVEEKDGIWKEQRPFGSGCGMGVERLRQDEWICSGSVDSYCYCYEMGTKQVIDR